MFSQFRKEVGVIVDSLIELAWYSRGSLQYHDAYYLTHYERERMKDSIENRFDHIKRNKITYPVY